MARALLRSATMLDPRRVSRDFASALEELHAHGIIALRHCEPEPCWREWVSVQRGARTRSMRVEADAVCVIDEPVGPRTLVLQVDAGTLSSARLRKRYEAILSWRARGAPLAGCDLHSLSVVTVCADTFRLERLRSAATHALAGHEHGLLWLTTPDAIDGFAPERLLEPRFYVPSPTPAPPMPLLHASELRPAVGRALPSERAGALHRVDE